MEMKLIKRTDPESLYLHAILLGFRKPFLDEFKAFRIDTGAVLACKWELVVVIVLEPERFENVREPFHMVGMPVGDHEIVDLALRDKPFDVTAYPFTGTAAR
jgi:hypothetical protein